METLLIAAEHALPIVRRLGYLAAFERMATDRGLEFSHSVTDTEPYEARIEHGRWLADCPNCRGAENVTADEPVMYCCSCGNEHLEGQLAPVHFPEDKQRKKLERLLTKRPRQNQNWSPGESIEQLMAENTVHGIESKT